MLIASAGLIAKEKNNPIQPKKIIANKIPIFISENADEKKMEENKEDINKSFFIQFSKIIFFI